MVLTPISKWQNFFANIKSFWFSLSVLTANVDEIKFFWYECLGMPILVRKCSLAVCRNYNDIGIILWKCPFIIAWLKIIWIFRYPLAERIRLIIQNLRTTYSQRITVEQVFVNVNLITLVLRQVRRAKLAALTLREMFVFEYTVHQVKQAV